MDLPVMPPVSPMLAKATTEVPEAEGLVYEPKWDGFRCIVFRDGDEVILGSRNERPLTRYFPELLEPVRQALPDKAVADGEVIVRLDGVLEFDALGQRIHPAESRVNMLAEKTPAELVIFDLLAEGDTDLREAPLGERRPALDRAVTENATVHLSPFSTDVDVARRWFADLEGANLDGVVAKPVTSTYQEDKRGWIKVKHERTADCVVAGFRWHKHDGVGSLLLGLWDDSGGLHHVGIAASFSAKRRAEFEAELVPLTEGALEVHPWQGWAEWSTSEDAPQRMPGAVSRWNAKKDLSWVPVRLERVAEVKYGAMLGERFRAVSHFVRWRPDRTIESCRYDQLDRPAPFDLAEILAEAVLELDVLAGRYAIARLGPEATVPDWAYRGDWWSMTRTADELSVICAQDEVPTGVTAERDLALLTVRGPFALTETGVLAALSRVLADAGVPILAVATFDTDHLLVPSARLDDAVAAFTAAGIPVSR